MKMMNDFIIKHRKAFYLYGLPIVVFMILVMIATRGDAPYSEVAIRFGESIQIVWYAVFILAGISFGAFLTYHEFKRLNWDTELLFDALLYAVPLSIVGARLYYVLFDPVDRYETFLDVIDITQGGLSIHGAVITAFIFVIFYTRKKKMNFWLLADMLAIGFLVGQIMGRWGNFMNQEAYGPIIESTFILNILPGFIKDQMFILGNYHHPTFLYEGIWNFAGLVFLLIARRKRWFKVGDMMALYLIWYGLGRGAIIEPLRVGGHPTDALRMFGLPANIILSIGLFMLGGIAMMIAKHYMIKDQKYYVDMLVDHNG